MSTYTQATVKIYDANTYSPKDLLNTPSPTPVKTSTEGGLQYPLTGLEEGKYFYTITGEEKGNILDFIEIPKDFPPNVTQHTVNKTVYPVTTSSQIINITDVNSQPLSGVIMYVNNYPYALSNSDGQFIYKLPRNPEGCIIRFEKEGYEPLRLKRGFPLSGNQITVQLRTIFQLQIRFKLVSNNSIITDPNIVCEIIYEDPLFTGSDKTIGEKITLTKIASTTNWTVPSNVTHNGTFRITSFISAQYELNNPITTYIINSGNNLGNIIVEIPLKLLSNIPESI